MHSLSRCMPQSGGRDRPSSRGLACVLLVMLAIWWSNQVGAAPSHLEIDLSGAWSMATAEELGTPNSWQGIEPWMQPGATVESWRRVELPANWHHLGLDDYDGWLVVRRQVELTGAGSQLAQSDLLALLIDGVRYGPFRLVVGGVPVGDEVDESIVPAPHPAVFELPSTMLVEDGKLTVALAVRRVDWASSGKQQIHQGTLATVVALGERSYLEQKSELLVWRQKQRSTLPLALIALAALLGLYHFARALRRRSLGSDFLLGSLAWLGWLFVYLVERGEILFPTHDLYRRCLIMLAHVLLALAIELIWRLLDQPLTRWLRLYQASNLLLAVLSLGLPILWLMESGLLRILYVLPVMAYGGYLMAKRALGSQPEDRLWQWTVLVFPVGLGIDSVLLGFGLEGSLLASTAALLGVSVISVLDASERFHRVHRDLEELSQTLEIEVDDQTEELASTNRRLQSQIAERHLVEGALRMLERAVEQSADGMAVTDLSGSTKFLNEAWAELHGHDVYDVLGYEIGLFHTSEQMQDEVYPLMAQVRQTGSFQGEVGHRRKDGSTFLAWMSVTRLLADDGEAMGMVSIARDITDQRQAAAEQLKLEKEAQQAEKLESLAILASGIAHDFNNLLTSILGHASLLARQLPEGAVDHGRVLQIESAADRAARLSDQLLSYAGEDQMAPVSQSINRVIEALSSQLTALVKPPITLQFQLKQDLPTVKVDREQIHHVVLQLVHNALEALPGGDGVITVRTSRVNASSSYFEESFGDSGRPPGPYVFFEVSDSGRGIEPETLGHIFDPFFTTKSGGRGLGLASSLGIVRAHAGAIKVYSQAGRGSTFEVLFPAASEASEELQDPREVRSWQGRGTILVVDDEELVREVAKDILEAQGFEVLTANEGRQAVRLFRKRRFDIRAVLLDLTMPQMDGEQAFRAMKMAEPNARVFLMSGYSQQQIRKRLEGEGIDGFLHKPFRPEDLLRLLRDVLEPS